VHPSSESVLASPLGRLREEGQRDVYQVCLCFLLNLAFFISLCRLWACPPLAGPRRFVCWGGFITLSLFLDALPFRSPFPTPCFPSLPRIVTTYASKWVFQLLLGLVPPMTRICFRSVTLRSPLNVLLSIHVHYSPRKQVPPNKRGAFLWSHPTESHVTERAWFAGST
jgi:hypothetical protein